ncbi:MAG TPA: UvrD-helicase domain-containing protein [Anaerolineae bacterium]|nr:UvrD-helicase domain-containing protein [Anaerolineae bacterium]
MSRSSILSQFKFTSRQKLAVTRRSPAIAVTAGAGSGKTRVLVGRYLHLLEKGYPLRSLVAITFTDKAAREMRTRIRAAIAERLADLTSNLQLPTSNLQSPISNPWEIAFTELDAARIGTIHSLCADILRAHPAEAGIDPNFAVLEESQAAALQAQAVETALAWAVSQSDTAHLIDFLTENGLRTMLTTLLDRRLDVERAWEMQRDANADWSAGLSNWLDAKLSAPAWVDSLNALSEMQARTPDDKLEAARQAVLAFWKGVRAARAASDWDAVFTGLAGLRAAMSTAGQKANWDADALASARAAMSALRERYDEELAPLAGKTAPARWALDRRIAKAFPALRRVYEFALEEYGRLKDARQALDFDDLEGRTARLLAEHAGALHSARRDVRAVLVDEFQDTNHRQREIVYALTGFRSGDGDASAELFVVGDAKQSIYKFRGADVTVFRQVQSDVDTSGGLTVDLDLTFRAHRPLVEVANALLAPVLGESDDPERPYQVPFARLRAHRQAPESDAIREPFVEFHIGLGDDAKTGRAAAAAALADRLRELRRIEGVEWGHIALLFRASTAFGVYEDALERASIPFVTVAGRGFYDRPEVRDLINALAAIADPTDDLALAGLLRSPAIGLSDADLYRLRFAESGDGDRPRPVWEALSALVERGTREDVTRARAIIAELHALSGRVSVAEILKRFLDLTGYRAILGEAPEGMRLRRNVDKLLADAHRSRLVSLAEFLEYVKTLQDVGVREGEAPVEAGGAVQLMTVHKSKGLEFPVVVIADAGYEPRGGPDSVLIDDDLGVLIGVSDSDGARPVAWRLASLNEAAKEDAEDRRLLYVAATRAKEKLIVSGHAKRTAKGALSLSGWLKRLGSVIGLDEVTLEDEITTPRALEVRCPDDAGPIACMLHPPFDCAQDRPRAAERSTVQEVRIPAPAAAPLTVPDLAAPLPIAPVEAGHPPSAISYQPSAISYSQSRVWRVVPRAKRPSGPAWVVGTLVHEALRRWRFPDEDNFDVFLWPFALETGLADAVEIQATIREARRLLSHFQGHPLFAEIAAAERYHEIPYTLPNDSGVIDLLYRTGAGWTVVDFKTDELRSEAEMREAIPREGYDVQLRRYADAVNAQLGHHPRALLVFLRVAGEVHVVELDRPTLRYLPD